MILRAIDKEREKEREEEKNRHILLISSKYLQDYLYIRQIRVYE